MERNEYHNIDCMEGMKEFSDKYFELAIVDPPYGLGFSDYERGSMGIVVKERYTKNGKKKWDYKLPDDNYFNELFRISQNQIIWGGNFFKLPTYKHCIFWYKKNPVSNFADGELAWSSFDEPSVCFEYAYYGNINNDNRIHPTQKPIKLYEWLLKNYAKQGDKILDTHVGSGSSIIAFEKHGFEYCGFEIDKDYYDSSKKRIEKHRELLQQETLSFPTR